MVLDSPNQTFDLDQEETEICDTVTGVCHTSIPNTRLAEGRGSEILEIIDSTLGIGISILDKNYRYKFINKLVYEQLQINANDLVVGDSFDKSIRLVSENFKTPLDTLDKYHPKHVSPSANNLLDSNKSLPLIKYPDGSVQKFVIKKLPDGQSICLNYDVSELYHKTRMLQKSLDLGKAGYCNYDFRTKKYDISETILESVPTRLKKQIQDHGLWAFVHSSSMDDVKQAFRDIPKNNRKLNITFKSRNRLWIKADGFAEKENGKWSILRIFLKDVTDSRRQKKEMEAAKNQAVEATEAKSRFLANMSHEIRTPMNGVIGMAELLALRELGVEEQKMVDIIARSAKSLLEIINDILDLSKIEAEALELETARVDLETMLTDIIALLHPNATEKNIDLKLVMPSDVPRYFMGDLLRLRQVMLNLVGNALKFTENGFISINVSWSRDSQGNSELKFSIVDTGIGMKQETIENIFEQFSQADNSTTRQYGGTGLGLSITKKIVELMDGTIGVTSVFNEGSNFTVTLPLSPTDADNPVVEKSRSAIPNQSSIYEPPIAVQHSPDHFAVDGKLDILVADDQEINRNVMQLMLAETQFNPVFAINGLEAVSKYSANPERYAVILMDISMPVMDGIEATDKIVAFKRANNLPHTPIIAVTGHTHKYTRDMCLAANMDDYMLKPVKRSVLVPKLEHWVQSTSEDSCEQIPAILQAG